MGNYGGDNGGLIMDIVVLGLYTLTLIALIMHIHLLRNNSGKTNTVGSIICIIANLLPTGLSILICSQVIILNDLFIILSITAVSYLVLIIIGVTCELWSLKIKKM
ncbi:hypothetical protein [Apilactobacillus ozensis]|uniref:hypothetical protein n=1 Tax=Apilactobacillus ozensis TaxID=866801 RepID=UPI00200A1DC9|nr:hypothetical protein [Apilactobacillus ozensis]MCK8607232.1 hypothetical protein [Apilactobacillus ozensis]